MSIKCYFVHIPGHAYAFNFYGKSSDSARAAARKSLGVSRLPNGTAVWEA